MNHSDDIDLIAAAFTKALAELDDVRKSSTANAGTYSYSYADLPTVMASVRPTLARHALAIMQGTEPAERGIAVSTRVLHESGQWIDSGPLVMPTGKGGPQDIGSAISYARRYSLLAFLGIATEDDDGKRAQESHEEATAPHPLSGRVSEALSDMKRLTDTKKQELREWADGRKLSGAAMLGDEPWLGHVEDWLAEYGGLS